jgi:hypothetical protein
MGASQLPRDVAVPCPTSASQPPLLTAVEWFVSDSSSGRNGRWFAIHLTMFQVQGLGSRPGWNQSDGVKSGGKEQN